MPDQMLVDKNIFLKIYYFLLIFRKARPLSLNSLLKLLSENMRNFFGYPHYLQKIEFQGCDSVFPYNNRT